MRKYKILLLLYKKTIMGKNVLDALIDGDSKIINKVYTTNFPLVKRFVLQNSGNEEDAKDVFQKALLQIAVRHRKEGITIETSFGGYLFKVCKNLWRRELNSYKKRVTNRGVIELTSEYRDYSLAVMEQKRQELLIEKLDKISGNCKNILTLFFAKTPYKEIVETTEYNSESAVRQRVFKCKKKLIELIENDERYKSLIEI